MLGREINTKEIISNVQETIKQLISEKELKPILTIIQVGNRPDSNSYVKNKVKLGAELGVEVRHINLEEDVTEEELLHKVKEVGSGDTHGLIVQLPLPKHINERTILNSIPVEKDVDGLGMEQIGKLHSNAKGVHYPCTALGVSLIINSLTNVEGKDVVIVNRSNLIGLPLHKILTNQNATVTVCHSKTNNLRNKMRNADIVVTGIGKADYFDCYDFKDGQIIIDCSMNINHEGKLCGDITKDDILRTLKVDVASGKGHTGPMTVTCLMLNTVYASMK